MKLHSQRLQTLEQIRAFLEGSQPIGFEAPAREAVYEWMAGELRRLRYTRLSKADKGHARRYTPADVRLLADLDTLHGTLSGPATRKLCERAYTELGFLNVQVVLFG